MKQKQFINEKDYGKPVVFRTNERAYKMLCFLCCDRFKVQILS